MNINELQSLDEALDYLNEGFIKKLIDFKNKYRAEKAKKKKEDKDLKEKGYTNSDYNWCKSRLQKWNDIYENSGVKGLIDQEELDIWGDTLYYLSISESEFVSGANKYAKENKYELDPEDLLEYIEEDYGEDSKEANLFRTEPYVCVGNNYGGDYLLYFIKSKKLYQWWHGEDERLWEITYSELIANGKDTFTIKGNGIDYESHNRFAKACHAADKYLGYNRLK